MKLIDIIWTPYVNQLIISCECGTTFASWSRFSVAVCPRCGKAELWHDVDPKPAEGPWSEPVMQNKVVSRVLRE